MDTALLVATNPMELAEAQRAMIADIGEKVEAAIAEARDAETMKNQMIEARLSASQARAIHRRATDRVTFLVKCKAALEAGYCMMPDMPGTVIAVRTTRETPLASAKKPRPGWPGDIPDHPADRSLPSGQGRYVDPRQKCQSFNVVATRKRADGSTYQDTIRHSHAVALTDPSGISRRFVRPRVVAQISRAMSMRLFDEIVCVEPADTRRKSRDPIVLGRVVNGRNVSAYLIAWFVDTNEL